MICSEIGMPLDITARDAHGRKMSKSLDNVVDPVDVCEGIHLDIGRRRRRDSIFIQIFHLILVLKGIGLLGSRGNAVVPVPKEISFHSSSSASDDSHLVLMIS